MEIVKWLARPAVEVPLNRPRPCGFIAEDLLSLADMLESFLCRYRHQMCLVGYPATHVTELPNSKGILYIFISPQPGTHNIFHDSFPAEDLSACDVVFNDSFMSWTADLASF